MLKTAGKILSRIFAALLAAALACNVYVIVQRQLLGVRQPTVFGFSTAIVLSGSMEPAIHVDDLVIVRERDSYAVGDVVMYEGENNMITHRIVALEDGAYITRGDANNTSDPAVPADRVVGKVVGTVHGAGAAIRFLRTPLGMCIMVLLAGAILVLFR